MAEKITIQPKGSLRGEIWPPGDKSISHRSVMISAIAKGVTEIENFLSGEDCIATIRAFQNMGVRIERAGTKAGNKGWDAAVAAMEMISLYQSTT